VSSAIAPALQWQWLTPRYWPTWLGVACLWFIAFIPWSGRHWLGEKLGKLMYWHNNKRRHIVLTNLRLCFPKMPADELERLTAQHFAEYGCALLNYSVLFFRARNYILQRTSIQGLENITRATQAQRNVLLLLGHSVWLEFAPAAIGQYYAAYGSYKPFNNPIFNWLIARSRLKDVEFVVAREEGMLKLVRSLRADRLLFFLPDQDHGLKHSTFAPFFATNKATLTSPARIAKMGKTITIPIMAFSDKATEGYKVIVGEALHNFGELDAENNATLMNQAFQQLIEQAPEQYMWTLKLLRTRPPNEVSPY